MNGDLLSFEFLQPFNKLELFICCDVSVLCKLQNLYI